MTSLCPLDWVEPRLIPRQAKQNSNLTSLRTQGAQLKTGVWINKDRKAFLKKSLPQSSGKAKLLKLKRAPWLSHLLKCQGQLPKKGWLWSTSRAQNTRTTWSIGFSISAINWFKSCSDLMRANRIWKRFKCLPKLWGSKSTKQTSKTQATSKRRTSLSTLRRRSSWKCTMPLIYAIILCSLIQAVKGSATSGKGITAQLWNRCSSRGGGGPWPRWRTMTSAASFGPLGGMIRSTHSWEGLFNRNFTID